jgi:DNA-binding transcriptional LysR family regulator
MESNWLKAFAALAETHSVRKAAARLQVSSATLSERVAALESYLGVNLFDRGVKGSELTEQGRLYLQDAYQLLNAWEVIVEQLRTMDSRPIHFLRLAFQEKVLPPVVARFLDEFLPRHPNIELSLYNDQEIDFAQGLNSGQVDLCFAYCPQGPSYVGLTRRPVFYTQLCALLPGDHRLAWKRSVCLSELDGETLLIYPETRDTSLRDRELEVLRVSGIRYSLYENHVSPVYYTLLVQMGRGIAICPGLLRGHNPRHTVFLPLTDPTCQCSIDMLYQPNNNNPALRLFLKEFGEREGEDDL